MMIGLVRARDLDGHHAIIPGLAASPFQASVFKRFGVYASALADEVVCKRRKDLDSKNLMA